MYASNFTAERRALWKDLCDIQSNYIQNRFPWVILGDFNVTLSSSEHSRVEDYMSDQAAMRDFQNTKVHCGLTDLPYIGPLFTWMNNQYENSIGKKLDRALVNGNWIADHPCLMVLLRLVGSRITHGFGSS